MTTTHVRILVGLAAAFAVSVRLFALLRLEGLAPVMAFDLRVAVLVGLLGLSVGLFHTRSPLTPVLMAALGLAGYFFVHPALALLAVLGAGLVLGWKAGHLLTRVVRAYRSVTTAVAIAAALGLPTAGLALPATEHVPVPAASVLTDAVKGYLPQDV
jgi:hypothetical protein